MGSMSPLSPRAHHIPPDTHTHAHTHSPVLWILTLDESCTHRKSSGKQEGTLAPPPANGAVMIRRHVFFIPENQVGSGLSRFGENYDKERGDIRTLVLYGVHLTGNNFSIGFYFPEVSVCACVLSGASRGVC